MASPNRLNKRISTGAPWNDQNNATRVFYINASVTNVPIFVVASPAIPGDIIINRFTT